MDNIKKLIEQLDIVELISSSIPLKKAGANFKGLCPFHGESTPSFVVSPKKRIFKCFGCGESGDALSFYMKSKKLSFIDAITELAAKYKVELHFEKKNDNSRYENLLKDSSLFFRESLFSEKGSEALRYLTGERGFSEKLAFNHFLGYAPEFGLKEYLKSKGYTAEEMERVGLVRGNMEIFRNRLMFTIFDRAGKVIGFGGRALKDAIPKYLNSQESFIFKKGTNLYGLFDKSELRGKEYAILVEGYTDVLALRAAGILNAVASLGTSLTEGQAKLLKSLVDNVVIMYDSDRAGQMATERAIYILKKFGFSVKVCKIEAKDPDEFLKRHDVQLLKDRIRDAVESMDYLLNLFSSEGGVIEKKKTIDKFKEFFSSLPNELEREIYLQRLATELKISKDSLQKYMYSEKRSKKSEKSYLDNLEELTLLAVLRDKSLSGKLSKLASISRSKISFLLGISDDNIEYEVKTFVNGIGWDFEEFISRVGKVEYGKELQKELIEAWRRKELIDEMEDLSSLAHSDRSEMILKYYQKKKELENISE